jgi:hypothetical protein
MNDKDQPPFNPIPLPPELSLGAPEQITKQQAHVPGAEQGKKTSRPKPKRRPRRPRKSKVPQRDANCAALTRWERIKGKMVTKLAQIDRETLRSVLLACGVAVGQVATVLLLIKMVPVAATLLGLLGIGLVIAIWDRIRRFPYGF